MNFASIDFGVFLLVVYSLYLVLPFRAQNLMLLAASYVFYGWWDWRFLGLLIFSTILDFSLGLAMGAATAPRTRRRLLVGSLAANLGILGFFKYFNFFSDSLVRLLHGLGLESLANWPTLSIVLPVGISFYTFQTLSYTIGVYRGDISPSRRLTDFALYVSLFPQLVAGPIERATHLLPQVTTPRTITFDGVTRGSYLILLGLFKKIAIADAVAKSVNAIYNSPGEASSLDVILATYLFAAQIYCDFAGYSDIARGTAKLMGFDLMRNFNLPYFSTNPAEFWRRWHISLSTWLRDYLYVPLGGNRFGVLTTYRNLMLTMLLGGLWHGAAWNFVLWGAYQGVLLCAHRAWSGGNARPKPQVTAWSLVLRLALAAVFFQFVAYGWLLFRAASVDQIIRFSSVLLSPGRYVDLAVPKVPLSALLGLPLLAVMELIEFFTMSTRYYQRWPLPLRAALYSALLFILLMGMSNARSEFIYFQF